MAAGPATKDREIVVTRVFDAPREMVFDAWTDRHQVGCWYGPHGFTTTTHEMDVRPGGVWRYTMHGPDGVDYENTIVYVEVVRPERLVMNQSAADAPGQFQKIVVFEEEQGKTRLTLRVAFESAAQRDMVVEKFHAVEGAKQTLERLQLHLAESRS